MFTRKGMTNIQEFTQKKRDSPLETAHITPETVKKKLLALKPIKYPGPDSLLVEEIVRPLVNITNKSLKEGKLLQEWIDAKVSQIYKK